VLVRRVVFRPAVESRFFGVVGVFVVRAVVSRALVCRVVVGGTVRVAVAACRRGVVAGPVGARRAGWLRYAGPAGEAG
jgi:hypothetical protein